MAQITDQCTETKVRTRNKYSPTQTDKRGWNDDGQLIPLCHCNYGSVIRLNSLFVCFLNRGRTEPKKEEEHNRQEEDGRTVCSRQRPTNIADIFELTFVVEESTNNGK